jgi:hypothetical protein
MFHMQHVDPGLLASLGLFGFLVWLQMYKILFED